MVAMEFMVIMVVYDADVVLIVLIGVMIVVSIFVVVGWQRWLA